MMIRNRTSLALALAAVLSGCPSFGPTYIACLTDAECPSEFFCGSAGLCVAGVPSDCDAACCTDSDCLDNQNCSSGQCTTLINCGDGGECPAGFACNELSLVCEANGSGFQDGGACVSKYDCALGEACSREVCRPPPSTCTIDAQCGRGQVCSAGSCIAGCDTSEDCDAPLLCSPVQFQCESCTALGGSNPCPSGQTCEQLNSGPECLPDVDGGIACMTKYDCPLDEACNGGTCGVPPSMCATDEECGRGQFCNISSVCAAGCQTNSDCDAPSVCSMTTFQCVPSCAGSQTCSDNSPGTVCTTAMTCGPCSQNSDCVAANPPYGPNFACVNGGCALMIVDAGPNCTNTNCNGTNCLGLPGTCNQSTCRCEMADAGNCSPSNCGGTAAAPVACAAGQTCVNCSACEGETDAGPASGTEGSSCNSTANCTYSNAYCAIFLGMEGTCTTSCTTSADCSSGVMCCSATLLGIAASCDIEGLASSAGGIAMCM